MAMIGGWRKMPSAGNSTAQEEKTGWGSLLKKKSVGGILLGAELSQRHFLAH